MKRRWVPMLALFLLLAGCTGSCGQNDVTGTAQPTQSAEPQASASPSAVLSPDPSDSPEPGVTAAPVETEKALPTPTATADPSSTSTPQATASPAAEEGPTDEEVLEAYEKAKEAFAWFQVAPMAYDAADQKEVDGQLYYRVTHASITTTADLQGYLKTLFSDSLVEKLLPYGGTQYIDVDGALYVRSDGWDGETTKGSETVWVLRDDMETRRTVRVTVELVDAAEGEAETRTYNFLYEQVGNKWIFTTFSLAS